MNKKIIIASVVLFIIGAILLAVGMIMPITTDLGILGTQTISIAQDMNSTGSNLFQYHDALIQLKGLGALVETLKPFLRNTNIAISGFSFIIISIAIFLLGFIVNRFGQGY